MNRPLPFRLVIKSLHISSTLTCLSSVSWLYIIFLQIVSYFQHCSAHICSTHFKISLPAHFQTSGSCFYIYHQHKTIQENILQMQIKPYLFIYCSQPLPRSFSTSTLLRWFILHILSALLSYSPHPLHPLIAPPSQSRLQVQVSTLCSTSKETNMCMLWCASNSFEHENKTYSEKYEWTSSLFLSEVSISALISHSCLHVQELHATHTHTHTICIH